MRPKNQRKTVIVERSVQMRIVLAISLPMFGALVLATLGELLYHRAVAAGRIASDGTIFGMPEERLGMLLLFVAASTIQLLTSLLASQKVAGTAYRIGRVLEAYRKGDRAVRARLRKGDFQQSLATDVNEFLDWIEAASSSGDATAVRDDVAPGRSATAPTASPERSPAPGTPARAAAPGSPVALPKE